MERDFARRFTDERYLTKEQIMEELKTSSVDNIFDKVLSYRKLYSINLELKSAENRFFSYTLNPSLMKKIVLLERRLTSMMISFSSLKREDQQELVASQLLLIGRKYASINSLTISDEQINDLIYKTTLEIPQEFKSLRNYLNLIKSFIFSSSNTVNFSFLKEIYSQFIRRDIYDDELLRQIELVDLNEHSIEGKHYDAAPLEKLNEMIQDLLLYLNNDDEFPLLKAIVLYFYFSYIVPFDYFNEEITLFLFKYLLGDKDYKIIVFLLTLEDDMFSYKTNPKLQKAFIDSELSLDLTYFINEIISIVENSLEKFFIEKADLSFEISKKTTSVNNNESYTKELPFERNVSLPTIPQGLDEKEISLVASSLCEMYPTLKPLQAQFYASHCTIGKYYTIAQYKKEMNVAYETARTSMDNLADLGLYKKEAQKNKFIYTPVIREKEETK